MPNNEKLNVLNDENNEGTNPNQPESIWAPGIPQNIDKNEVLGQDQIQAMAIEFIVKKVLLPKGFMIEMGFPRKDFPNIICRRDNVVYSIVVFPSVYPNFAYPSDEFRLKIMEIAKQTNSTALFAPVGYSSVDEARAKASLMLKGDVFKTSFPGFKYLTHAAHEDPKIVLDELFRP